MDLEKLQICCEADVYKYFSIISIILKLTLLRYLLP